MSEQNGGGGRGPGVCPVKRMADEIASADPCAPCGHAIRVGSNRQAIESLPWACGWTGGVAAVRCERFTTDEPDYKKPRCVECGSHTDVKPAGIRTRYANSEQPNPELCPPCRKDWHDHWDEMWSNVPGYFA